jgi:site-specific DNA-cytosine methylase
MTKLKVLDLFSGIGGFSLGLERTGGFETVAFCEIDPFCRKVLAKHWPTVRQYEDVKTLTAERLSADGVVPDVICGGFPCQDISFAGKGAGIEGERSGLWSEYARLIGELRPEYVIVENVAALLSRGLDRVLGDLASIGFDAEWHCIPASAVGAPHRRDRLWLVAYPECSERRAVDKTRNRLARPFGLPQGEKGSIWSGGGSQDVAYASGERCGEEGQHSERRAEWSAGSSQISADAYSARLSLSRQISLREDGELGGGMLAASDWWRIEPDVGGGFDGFPVWLDRYVGNGLSYEESQRATEALRCLWSSRVSQALRRAIGGLDRIQQAEVLFAFVREYQAGVDEARLLVAGAEVSEGFLRSLRCKSEVASPSHRSGHQEQRASEHSDVVQVLPRLLAFDGPPHWAGSGWEDATPRVAVGVPNRVDRLRALGNAVVPQIPEIIGRAILEARAA